VPYLYVFLINYFLELSVYFFMSKRSEWSRWVKVALITNLLTHPLIWFCLPNLWKDFWSKLIISEVIVFTTEILLGIYLLKSFTLDKKAIITRISLANLFSLAFTFILPF